MTKETAYIFIDEFGTNGFNEDNNGTTSHFVYTAFVVPESKVESARKLRNDLSLKYKQGAPLASKRFDKNDPDLNKRIDFLKDLTASLDFIVDVLVVDKSKLEGEGLKRKQIFYKYFQSLFISRYDKRFKSFRIYADRIGTDEYCEELTYYVLKKNAILDLFNQDRYFQLADDKHEEPLIQLADMICGSLGKIYSASHVHHRAQEIHEILHLRTHIEFFPYNQSISSSDVSEEDNNLIRRISLDSVESFKNNNTKDRQLSDHLIDFLLLHFRIDPTRFVQSYEIETHLKNFEPNISIERIRKLIRDIRYDGVFVISVGYTNGYKLANTYKDILDYFKHYSSHFIPMLKKIEVLNSELSISSFNEINPVEKDPSLLYLKAFLRAIELQNKSAIQ